MQRTLLSRQAVILLALIGIMPTTACTPSFERMSATLTGSVSLIVADTSAADITGSWGLMTLSGLATPSEQDAGVRIVISSERITAQRGCMRLDWRYTLVDAALTTTRVASTVAPCPADLTLADLAIIQFVDDAPIAALREDGALVLAMEDRRAVFERHTQ